RLALGDGRRVPRGSAEVVLAARASDPKDASATVGFINPVGLSICSGVSIATDSVVGSVVVSAASGDETAFASIIARYDDDLARVAYLVTADVGLAHDAVQAAWQIAWRKRRTWCSMQPGTSTSPTRCPTRSDGS